MATQKVTFNFHSGTKPFAQGTADFDNAAYLKAARWVHSRGFEKVSIQHPGIRSIIPSVKIKQTKEGKPYSVVDPEITITIGGEVTGEHYLCIYSKGETQIADLKSSERDAILGRKVAPKKYPSGKKRAVSYKTKFDKGRTVQELTLIQDTVRLNAIQKDVTKTFEIQYDARLNAAQRELVKTFDPAVAYVSAKAAGVRISKSNPPVGKKETFLAFSKNSISFIIVNEERKAVETFTTLDTGVPAPAKKK